MFTKYGYTTIGIISILSFVLIAASFFIQNNTVKIILIAVAVICLAFTLGFFRDPDRTTPDSDEVIVSPADGKVLFVKERDEDKFVGEKVNMISIFMSPLNVHVNRIPIDGVVDYLQYYEGEYVAAFEDKASETNERMEIGITSKYGKILFTQVAGMVARRIVIELEKGDTVKMGERFGMIKFGSRVDVFAPLNWKPKISKDESVTAAETILFELDTK
ncbi:MAG: phosphatidylserine decarboxylase family protein [Ignavibacteria bacterium]|nr:phosphatidylserine decarboxylase family protein [Ignavibacteria bacterium]